MSVSEIMNDILEAKAEIIALHNQKNSSNFIEAASELEKAYSSALQALIFLKMEHEA